MMVLIIYYLIMLPSHNASLEMSTAYYILVVPQWLKTISFYAFLVFVVASILYFRARIYKNATLTFGPNELQIKGKTIDKSLPFYSIKEVWANDLKSNELQIVLRQKHGKDTTFFLKNYSCSESFMEIAMDVLKGAKFSSYEMESLAMQEGDD